MEQCYECYADKGFYGTGIKALAKYCDCTSANLYAYFENVDDLIIQSTGHCMSKVEDDIYLKSQIEVLKESLELFSMKYNPTARSGTLAK